MSDQFRAVTFLQRAGQPLRALVRGRMRVACVVGAAFLIAGTAIADVYLPNLFPFLDLTGLSGTYNNAGKVDLSGPFFQSLGTNGRSCATCHQANDAFGLSAVDAQLRYLITRGQDPLFAQIDGSTCPTGPDQQQPCLEQRTDSNRIDRSAEHHRRSSRRNTPLRPCRIRMGAPLLPIPKGCRPSPFIAGLCPRLILAS